MDNRTATDAVHARLQPVNFYCETCKMEFRAKEIQEHFSNTRSHDTKGDCAYCQGSDCYGYIDDKKRHQIWHKCRKS